MNTTVITKLSNKTEVFFNSKYSLITFGSLFLIVSIIQYILFGIGYELGGITNNDSDAWKEWCLITFTFLGSVCNIFSTIFTIRLSKHFFIWQIFGSIFMIMANYLLLMWLDLSKYVFLTIIYFKRKLEWGKEKEKIPIKKMDTRTFLIHTYFALIISLILGYLIFALDQNKLLEDPLPFMDALIITFLMLGCYQLIKANDKSWISFLISDTIAAVAFGLLGQWNVLIMSLIYIYIDLITYFIWRSKHTQIQI